MDFSSHRTLFQANSDEICRLFNKTITLPLVLLSLVFDFYFIFCKYPVSSQFFGEFDMLTFTTRHFEKPLIPSSTQPTRKPPKAALKPNG